MLWIRIHRISIRNVLTQAFENEKDIQNISITYLKMKIKYMQEEIQNFENAISGNE